MREGSWEVSAQRLRMGNSGGLADEGEPRLVDIVAGKTGELVIELP
jgi:hypothetical protein